MPKQFMRVKEGFSGTLWEDGLVDEPVLNHDGGEIYEADGSLRTKQVKGKVSVPVTLNKGITYQSDHRYVKTWPQHFEPLPEKVEA